MNVKVVTAGAYSDYSFITLLYWKSLRTPKEVLQTYLGEFPEQQETFRQHQFLAYVLRNGYATEVECTELWLGDGYFSHPDDVEEREFAQYDENGRVL